MKKLYLILISLFPLLIGFIIEHLIINYDFYGFRINLISVVFLFIWFFIGAFSREKSASFILPTVLGNLTVIILSVLMSIQLITIGHFASGFLGHFPQIASLPTISMVGKIDILNLIHHSTLIIYLSFLLQLVVFSLGYQMDPFDFKRKEAR